MVGGDDGSVIVRSVVVAVFVVVVVVEVIGKAIFERSRMASRSGAETGEVGG